MRNFCFCLSIPFFLPGTLYGASGEDNPGDIMRRAAPHALAAHLDGALPFRVSRGDEELVFAASDAELFEGRLQGLAATALVARDSKLGALSWEVTLRNEGDQVLDEISYTPLFVRFHVDPEQTPVRVRYMTGSYHYDACYPPRAYQLQERVFTTHDHAKPVRIGGSGDQPTIDYAPLMQLAVGPDNQMAGLFVGFEWSEGWHIEAGWENPHAFQGEPLCDLLLRGNMELGPLTLAPGETLILPRVHMGFFDGPSWAHADNRMRRYLRERLSATLSGKLPPNIVRYDSWFGIHANFDKEVLMRQAKRAAELGIEYFCVGGGWYGAGAFGSSNTGRWDAPDPAKFPGGTKEMKALSEYVRSLGMGFGIYHLITTANYGNAAKEHPELFRPHPSGWGGMLAFEKPEAREFALDALRRWIKDWDVSYMFFEYPGTGDLAYMTGLYEVLDTVREEFPDCYIEGVYSGGTRFDWGMTKRTHGCWISDHAANRDVCRYMQSGALRFWPSHFLNAAVRVHQGSGDKEAYSHNILSRMVGTLSFTGDIAQWTPEAAQLVKQHVDVYKATRDLKTQDVFFPLPQPQSSRDWDAIVYGDGRTGGQLLFVFRMEGPDAIRVRVPGGTDGWTKLLGDASAHITPEKDELTVQLGRNSSGLWLRD